MPRPDENPEAEFLDATDKDAEESAQGEDYDEDDRFALVDEG